MRFLLQQGFLVAALASSLAEASLQIVPGGTWTTVCVLYSVPFFFFSFSVYCVSSHVLCCVILCCPIQLCYLAFQHVIGTR